MSVDLNVFISRVDPDVFQCRVVLGCSNAIFLVRLNVLLVLINLECRVGLGV